MGKIVIYRDNTVKEAVIEGVSKMFPNNYEVSYTTDTVIIKNLERNRNDLKTLWNNITDNTGKEFTTFNSLKEHLAIVFEPISVATMELATQVKHGLMAAEDKKKLDELVGDVSDVVEIPVATDTWVVTLPPGKNGGITCLDSLGRRIEGDEDYSVEGQVTIYWNSIISGKVLIN